MNFEECLNKGFIKKDSSMENKVLVSINKSKKFLSAISVNINAELFDVAVIVGYSSIFCCNQALLFKKGYSERSHSCLVLAVRKLYANQIELISFLNAIDDLRFTRHRIQYSGLDADLEMCDFVKTLANGYFQVVCELLEIKL
ncbi:MAG: HEPN domain-containing protein [Candidatus ainarchaeum sp.]|nr:HEPN domain-containing protein [Candidatus ainarchaeum sp.]